MRTREIAGKAGTETTYLITGLPAAHVSPERLLALNGAHWAIENKLHHVRDVSLDEDRCRVRAGARALSGVRNAAIAVIRCSRQPVRQAAKTTAKTVPTLSKPYRAYVLVTLRPRLAISVSARPDLSCPT